MGFPSAKESYSSCSVKEYISEETQLEIVIKCSTFRGHRKKNTT